MHTRGKIKMSGNRNREIIKQAFVKSIPIMCSYLFVSMAYGMMMEAAGFHWYDSLLVSLTVYTGAFQFVLITFLEQRSLLCYRGTYSISDEQQTVILQPYIS